MTSLCINLTIDGTSPEDGFTFVGDVDNAPFYVYDVDAQENIAGPYATRLEAAWSLAAISLGRVKSFMSAEKA